MLLLPRKKGLTSLLRRSGVSRKGHLHKVFVRDIPTFGSLMLGKDKCTRAFACTNFLNTPRGPGHPGKISGTSQIPLFETQRGHKLSREGTNFSATTPSRGRPPPHWAVSGPNKKLIFVLFFCLTIGWGSKTRVANKNHGTTKHID